MKSQGLRDTDVGYGWSKVAGDSSIRDVLPLPERARKSINVHPGHTKHSNGTMGAMQTTAVRAHGPGQHGRTQADHVSSNKGEYPCFFLGDSSDIERPRHVNQSNWRQGDIREFNIGDSRPPVVPSCSMYNENVQQPSRGYKLTDIHEGSAMTGHRRNASPPRQNIKRSSSDITLTRGRAGALDGSFQAATRMPENSGGRTHGNGRRIDVTTNSDANYGMFGRVRDVEQNSPVRDSEVWHGRRRTTITNFTEDCLNKELGVLEPPSNASPVPVCSAS
jgi:hypothetical protein